MSSNGQGNVQTGGMAVAQHSSPNQSVDIAVGDLVITYQDYAFYTWIDALYNLALTASASNNRIDAIVAYVDLTVVSSASNNNPGTLKFMAVTGTPNASPVAPNNTAIQSAVGAGNPFFLLATVYCDLNYTQMLNAKITDKRSQFSLTSGNDGWINGNETWTYASATTITVPTDATLKYAVGDKIRLKQGGSYLYFYIIGVASTTLTITGGTDYTLANSAITDNWYSHSSSPVGFPSGFNYTPTYTGFTGGVTTSLCKFIIEGRIVTVWFNFLGTSNAASMTITTPVTVTQNVGEMAMPVAVDDNSSWQSSPGVIGFNTGDGNTAKFYFGKLFNSFVSDVFAGFTSSGSKGAVGSYSYSI